MKTFPARKLLIVDDDPEMRRGLRLLFEKEYQVNEAASGDDGIELSRNAAYAVVILDLVMEGMSGIETLQHLKKINEFQKVIILTGYGCQETAISAVNMGAFKYLLKPVAFKLLKELVRAGFECYERDRDAISGWVNKPQQLEMRGLSPREAEVAFWASRGESNVEIARRFDISRRTVEKQLERAYAKLGIGSRGKLLRRISE